MKRENYITEYLASGILDTDKPLEYGVLNTENYGVIGYHFIAGVDSSCLEELGCFPEDIEKADRMKVGETLSAEYPSENAIIIIKLKDSRK